MKLTKLHIFLILLVSLILCSYFGMCSNTTREGYTSSTYGSYSNYYKNLNDANISATDWSQGLDDTINNPYYNKNDEFHKKYKKDYKKSDYSYKDDLNGGDKNDSSTYMISTSYKKNKNYDSYDKDNYRHTRNNDIFDSVSSGAMNGSMFSKSKYNYDNNSDDSNDNNDNNDNDSSNGITRDKIPKGQEDLYILKSQALTPICPACPSPPKVNCNDKCGKSKCPPCPPCARCPEPQFDCVKVPNYNTTNLNQNLPIPWMSKL